VALDAEVVVVGAGVAGTATALGLAARGHEVVLLDRAAFPREKPCGEGLMPHGVAALGRLGLGDLPARIGGLPFTGIGWHVDDAEAVGRFPGDRAGYGVRRSALDHALHGAALATGRIALRTGARVRGTSGVGGAREVALDGGTLRCRAVVAADGLQSPIRRAAGLQSPESGRLRYGVRAHFRLAAGWRDRDRVDVWAAENLEFYLTPTGRGEVNLAILLDREASRDLAGDLTAGFQRLCAEFPPIAAILDGATALTEPRLCGPLRQQATAVAADGLLLVGDAAGFVDALTGEGMSLGLLSAELAAEELSRGLRRNRLSAADLAGYGRRRAAEARELLWLTEIVLWGIRHRRLARRVVRNLGRNPELFGRILAVNTGEASLRAIGARGIARLLGVGV
jgi:2-polyprenyl-6-methoxyphenol hydroxylase-like FAD-dependent oxidoreductase